VSRVNEQNVFMKSLSTAPRETRSSGKSDFTQGETACNDRGAALNNRGDSVLAVADFDQTILLGPEQPEAFFSREAAHLLLERTGPALGDLTRAIALDPRHVYAYAKQAVVNAIMGNLPAAEDDVDRAVALGADKAALEQRLRSLAARQYVIG